MSDVGNARISSVGRFDTVVFNQETNVLQVWRYRTGLYQGEHVLGFSIHTDLIKSDVDFRDVVRVISTVAGLSGYSEERGLPSPWKGYRFI